MQVFEQAEEVGNNMLGDVELANASVWEVTGQPITSEEIKIAAREEGVSLDGKAVELFENVRTAFAREDHERPHLSDFT